MNVLRIDDTGTHLDYEDEPVMYDIDGVAIYDGDAYYEINGYIYAEETIQYYRKFA